MANITKLIYKDEHERADYNKLSTYEIVDAVLLYFETHEDKGLPFSLYQHDEALDFLDMYELIKYRGGSRQNIAYITPFGRQIAVKGFANFIQEQVDKAKVDAARQKLNDEKLKYDVKNSRRVFKTYWWTFWFSVISIGYVLLQVFLKVIDLINGK